MKIMKILICDGLEPQGLEILKSAQGLEVDDESPISREVLKGIIENYHALVVRSRTVVDTEMLKLGKRLLAIGRAGTGVDNIDVDEATHRGILVMNTPGANALAAAEHTIALMLALARHIPQAALSMREGR